MPCSRPAPGACARQAGDVISVVTVQTPSSQPQATVVQLSQHGARTAGPSAQQINPANSLSGQGSRFSNEREIGFLRVSAANTLTGEEDPAKPQGPGRP